MTESDIRKHANLMSELGLTALEVTEDNQMLRLERTPAAQPAVQSVSVASAPPADEDFISIRSPMVGVFYQASSEDADPYVSVGDRIEVGQTLCIIEAMKLMNEIPSEVSGTIAEICVKNGQAVDYGCELFRLRR